MRVRILSGLLLFLEEDFSVLSEIAVYLNKIVVNNAEPILFTDLFIELK